MFAVARGEVGPVFRLNVTRPGETPAYSFPSSLGWNRPSWRRRKTRMKTTRIILALAFLGLVVSCEPDPAGPEVDGVQPEPAFFAPRPPSG